MTLTAFIFTCGSRCSRGVRFVDGRVVLAAGARGGGREEGGTFVTSAVILQGLMRADQGRRDYGRCPCSGTYEQRFVEVRMTVNGKVVVLTNVPQGACPTCGSRVYKAEVLERIESLMKGHRFTKSI
jgi:YgiT-type zinc finger domain-containing protein